MSGFSRAGQMPSGAMTGMRWRTYVQPDVVIEFPQSGERFVGSRTSAAQFENYPGLEPGTTQLEEVIGGTTYALTPSYTVIDVDGSGDRGTAVLRVRYPDGSMWFAVNSLRAA